MYFLIRTWELGIRLDQFRLLHPAARDPCRFGEGEEQRVGGGKHTARLMEEEGFRERYEDRGLVRVT